MVATEPSAFGMLLRRHRVEAELTQEDLAERAQVSVRVISDLERGVTQTPRTYTVRQLGEALQLSEDERTAFTTSAHGKPASDPPMGADGAEPAGVVRTFLIADVRGYTRFTNERGDEAAAQLAARFAVLSRQGVEARGGRLLELRGDEALAVFDSVRSALHAALDLQTLFAEASDDDPMVPLPVGIGLDAGESIAVEGGYRGGALNLAARLCSVAGPGEVLASAGVVHLARHMEGVAYVERGEVALKGLADPIQVIQIMTETSLSLAVDLPPIASVPIPPPDTPFVFVCYARADYPFAARLIADLEASGVPCWTDVRGLKPGTPDWEQGVRDAIRGCQAVLLVASCDSRQSRYVKAELSVAEMYRRPVYPLWAAGDAWIDCIPLALSGAQYLDARGAHYAPAITQLRTNLGTTQPGDAVPTAPIAEELTTEPRNPYKGLRAFTEYDAGDFFGRTSVIDELVETVQNAIQVQNQGVARLLTVVGPSGSGKSSVVMAGLLPRLRGGALPHSDSWVYLEPIVPGNHPVEALTIALADKIDRSPRAIDNDLDADSSRGLHLLASQLLKRRDGRVVLLIDQFEEIFTQAADETERRQFVDLLVTAMTETRGPVIIILTVRADFYHQIMRYPDLWQLVETHTRFIAPMSAEELREVIELPTGLPDTRLTFEGDLVGDLLFELRGHEGALPLLQFTLDQLFERRDGRCLTVAAYRELGGVQGALAGHAEATYENLPSDEHRSQARALFLRLIEPGASEQDTTRRRLDLTELVLPDARETAILEETATAFVQARLLITNEVAGVSTLEVGHEALIRSWPRLYGWVQDDRGGLLLHRKLTEAALEWQREKDEGLLYRGTRLAALQDWVQRTDGSALNETERAFVEASIAHKAREEQAARERQEQELAAAQALVQSERRRAQVARSLLGVLAVVLVAALGAAAFAIQQSRQAQLERNDAKSHDIAVSALAHLATNPELSVLLGIEAVHFAPTDQAETALRQALSASPVRAVLRGHTAAVTSAAFSPDGTRVVTASQDNTARIWDARTGKSLSVLGGHTQFVNSAVFSPNGALGVTASEDQTARVWNARTGRLVTTLRGHTAAVKSAAFSPDSKLIVTASQDDTARVWQAETGQLVSVLHGHSFPVVSAAFSPDGKLIVTASDDHTAGIWQTRTGHLVHLLQGHTSNVANATFSPDGRYIVTASADTTAGLWKVSTGKLVRFLTGHLGNVNTASFSPDSTLIVTASDDKTARIWDGRTGKPRAVLRGHTASIHSAAFSPDGRLIVTASEDRTARVWQASSGRLLTTLIGHGSGVNSAAFNPYGTLVVTAGGDDTARVWRTFTGQLLTSLVGHRASVNTAAFSPDSKQIVTASDDNTARVWDSATGTLATTLKGLTAPVNSAAFSPNGNMIVTAGADNKAELWNAHSGTLTAVLKGHSRPVDGATFSSNSALVATVSEDKTARVWDAGTRRLVSTLRGHTGILSSAAFSPDGRLVVTGSYDGTARIWQARTGRLVHTLHERGDPIVDVAFSPDGSLIVTASGDHTARLWNTATGTLAATLRGHSDAVNSAAFSPDGKLIATASADHTARVWDAHSGAVVAVLSGHGDTVNSAAFSPDSSLVVTASSDQTARVWRASSGKLVMVLRGHSALVRGATFSPDGSMIVTSSGDGTARVYSCDVCGSVSNLLDLARTRATRHLTPEERAAYL